ncbi:DUF2934 domain-containing protein [Nitrospira sp. NS4]|uniref:DUF2934 domain-containing protein n=1 Tax=Nitrospira sp. NS4 TaxID=3414498 RepID=UPI003C3049EB
MKLYAVPGSRRKVRAVSSRKEPEAGGSGPGETGASEDLHARIAALAYQFYEQRGRGDGHEVDDWLAAEQRVLTGH